MPLPEGVYLIPDLLAPEECRELIEFSEWRGYEPAPITTASGFAMRPDIRNNARVMSDDPALAARLWDRARIDVPGFYRGRQAIGLNEQF